MKKVLIIILMLFAVFAAIPGTAYADDGFVIEGSVLVKYTGSSNKVVVPMDVTAIGQQAFTKNAAITDVYLPPSVTEIGAGAFEYCQNLKQISLSESLKEIGPLAFRGCERLEFVSLPEGLTYIGSNAFLRCNSLTKVMIPDSLEFLDYGVFAGCMSLETIYASAENSRYSSADGILYSSDWETLVQYPSGKNEAEVTVSEKVKTIGRCAFYENYTLEKINLPENLAVIGEYAFKDCHLLKEIRLPGSVAQIGEHAFTNCYNLKSVTVSNPSAELGVNIFEGCSNVVLRADEDSTAMWYARNNGISFEAFAAETPVATELASGSEDETDGSHDGEAAKNLTSDASNPLEEVPAATLSETDDSTAQEGVGRRLPFIFYILVAISVISFIAIILSWRQMRHD